MRPLLHIDPRRVVGQRSPMLYGQFIEHFHRQIYGGIYQPGHPLSDDNGFRTDILDAMRRIRVPILRWPGGCFVSAYHWKDAVGPGRTPMFDKAWRVEDPNTFGTDEYIKLCRALGCEPYICTNAGTGTAEEMSDWAEYCNLPTEGKYAKQRIANGFPEPHNVRYWSIGNENYGSWEIGAKAADEWARLVRESAKMLRRVSPAAELSAAALPDVAWSMKLLETCGEYLDWVSIHEYWDMMTETHDPASYAEAMAYTHDIGCSVRRVRGMLAALGLEGRVKIAFDEWNLRSWHHPNVMTKRPGLSLESYLTPRDRNDDNSTYTMADAVFTACFLSAMHRNCDVVGMANFSPVLNTTGLIYSYDGGIVLRSTYHVYDLYVNHLGDRVVDLWLPEPLPTMEVPRKGGGTIRTETLDLLATAFTGEPGLAVAAVNKHPDEAATIEIPMDTPLPARMLTLNGPSKDSYNDVGRTEVTVTRTDLGSAAAFTLPPHSVSIIELGRP